MPSDLGDGADTDTQRLKITVCPPTQHAPRGASVQGLRPLRGRPPADPGHRRLTRRAQTIADNGQTTTNTTTTARLDRPRSFRNVRVDSLLRLIDSFDTEIDQVAKTTARQLASHPGYTAVQTLPGV